MVYLSVLWNHLCPCPLWFPLFLPLLCTKESIGLLFPHATRTSYLQKFKYVWRLNVSPASLLKQTNCTFQSSVQLLSVLILLKIIIKSRNPRCLGYIAKEQCVKHCLALCYGTARQDEAAMISPMISTGGWCLIIPFSLQHRLQIVTSYWAAGKCRPHNV